MGGRVLVAGALALALLVPAGAVGQDGTVTNGTVSAHVSDGQVILGNEYIRRWWRPDILATTSLGIFRNGASPDFALDIDGVTVTSNAMPIRDIRIEHIPDGLRIVWDLLVPDVARVTRTVEATSGVAALRSQTTIDALVPFRLGGYTLDEIPAIYLDAEATIHDFRAGADWRYDAGFDPTGIGDNRTGAWRRTVSGGPNEPIRSSGQWLELRCCLDGRGKAAVVAERRHAASSYASFDGTTGVVGVDFSRDIVYTGPFEEQIHVENPLDPVPTVEAAGMARTSQPGARGRLVRPGRPLALEPAVTLLAGHTSDTVWGWHEYLAHRLRYPKAVTFNTNGVDRNAISTGAKDDVDFDRFVTLAEAARAMGVETFILDDGWQARSGDWCPDSPACPEPRWDGVDQRFAPRFPDDTFTEVRRVLAGGPGPEDDIALGLWMTPMEYHPSSGAYETNPQWACMPVGTATGAASYANQGGSFDAGIGVWNPSAIGLHPDTGQVATLDAYMEDRVARAIETYGATYFKFDFLVWIDCAGVEPVDMYEYHDAFVAMLDRLQARFPEVTFQIDETNDYRMFPFESVVRGPSWFQNGKPRTEQLLHNIWNLAPWVPGYSLGQHAASNDGERRSKGVHSVMAPSLGSHITFWNEIDAAMTPAERAAIRGWTDFYRAHRSTLATLTYPLLDDPLEGGWTALQPWHPREQHGWLLAYRQDDGRDTVSIPLRAISREDGYLGVPRSTYRITRHDPATGTADDLGLFDEDELRAGLSVTIPDRWGYRILRIERIEAAP